MVIEGNYHTVRQRLKSTFSDLIFDESKHLYYLDGVNFISVSKKVEAHAPKFNTEEMLPLSAAKASREEKREVTVHELRHKWQTINRTACDLGHQTHDFMENYTGIEKPRTPQEEAGVKFFHDMSKEYEVIFREIRMYSRRFKYAGTEDLILIHKQTGRVTVADYKTNGDLFKNYKGQTLYKPFDSLLNCPYNKYQLQLSYYEIMLEEAGLEVDDRMLIYLKADATYKLFNTWDYTNELKNLMAA
jgi:GTP cyclohydrolase II